MIDPRKASYGVEHATYAVVQLAQTTMRSELGKISLDKTFEERDMLNRNIVQSIQCAPSQQTCQLWLPRAASLAKQSLLRLTLPASALWTSMHEASQSCHCMQCLPMQVFSTCI